MEHHSISSPPRFDGKNFTEWKERMRTFIQSVDFKLWLVIKNGPKVPTKLVDNEEVEKSEDEYDEEDMKNSELEAKARHILYCTLNADAPKIFSEGHKTAKQIWDELDREMTGANSPSPQLISHRPSVPLNYPDLYFLDETRESMDKFLKFCVPLHKCALRGNWREAKCILDEDHRLKHAAITREWSTLLHIAAGANQFVFVEKLLQELNDEHIVLQDSKGQTAFCLAVASGNMPIVRLLNHINPRLLMIRDRNENTPIQFALMQGKSNVAQFLYYNMMDIVEFDDQDKKSLFFTAIKAGNYHMAARMAEDWEEIAFARDENNETALHVLALNDKMNHGKKQSMFFQLVKFLWNRILGQQNFSGAIRIISEPSKLLFNAAKVGNFGFLSELISSHPSLIWEVDDKRQSIIHTAVSHRHSSIFNLIHEIGSAKDVILSYIVQENNTILHLAAKLAPPGRLGLVSGAPFQMCLELIWFEEVKKIMPPSFIMFKNSDGLTAQELFTMEHEGLRKEGEEWMKRTAEFCMLISTVIATAVFSAAVNIPGGIDEQTKKPNYLDKTSFLVFAISDAAAFVSSAIAILIFLSIIVSPYAEYDFYKSLPLKLICGLVTLFISIACMMVAFDSAFFITYNYGSKVVPNLIAVLACVPMLLFIALQFPLWSDIIYAAFYCRTMFKSSKRMIHLLD
ncbi:hypothetical protein JHK85_024656 [Glycine max]|nr:hypothetical protein JHK85_024656 [Glycine max]